MSPSTSKPARVEVVNIPVVPEYTIRAEIGVSGGQWAYKRTANGGEFLRNEGFLARTSADLRSARILRPLTANSIEPIGELKQHGDSDDANRRLAEPRSPFLLMETRLDVVPGRYVPTKDARGLGDNR